MTYNLTEGQLDGPADVGVVDGLSLRLGVALPGDYLGFPRQHNGGEGFIVDNYIIFWKAEEIADFNHEYELKKYAPASSCSAPMAVGRPMGSRSNQRQCQSSESHSSVWSAAMRRPWRGISRTSSQSWQYHYEQSSQRPRVSYSWSWAKRQHFIQDKLGFTQLASPRSTPIQPRRSADSNARSEPDASRNPISRH